MYYERTISNIVKEATKTFKVVMLTGPRQVGKSTLFDNIIEQNRKKISLDDIDILSLAKNDPNLFFQIYTPPLLIDEVQKAPELFSYIKKIVDNSSEKGLFWLTGSHKFSLMKNVSESLAGRVAVLDLQGLSQAEKLKNATRPAFIPDIDLQTKRQTFTAKEIFKNIIKGSYPQLFDGLTNRELYYKSYKDTYLLRDIKDIIKLEDETIFTRFIKILASRTSQVLNYADIAKDADIAPNTAKAWIGILQTLGIIYLLQPYFENNINKRLTKSPKIYFMDTGLCSYLCGINDTEMLMNSYLSGAFIETYAVSEIIKSYIHNGRTPNIYYLRTSNKNEIDVVLEENGKVYPIEIKQTATPNLSMAKNFKLIDEKKKGVGAILCLSDKFIPLNKDVYIIPISYI
ncbi:MAG: ATP-binding protein [Alphaproteobacteria bacterium]|nr:ATP-binding protein [Alphaproteobacteria bacterium]